jgi:ZIP family zinc transporter
VTTAILAAKRFIENRLPRGSDRPLELVLKLVGISVALTGAIYLIVVSVDALVRWLSASASLRLGLAGSLAAGLATGVGALPALFLREIKVRTQDMLLGFGAGVMLAASCFSLIFPGIAAAHELTGSKPTAAFIVAAGLGIGGVFLAVLDHLLPHEHFIKGREGLDSEKIRGIWLFIIAITLHNFPEGLAVGVGFGGGDLTNAITLAIGIGLQNMPEGLVVALALLTLKYSPLKAFAVALATGLVEPVGGLLGAGAVSLAESFLPWAMGFAAGAMIFVVSHEIIPESHRKGHEHAATAGVLIGFLLMMLLDTSLS